MIRPILVLVLVGLAGVAFGEEKSTAIDVPAAQGTAKLTEPCVEPAAPRVQMTLREERRHDEHVAVAGLGTLGFFYASDAMLALSSGLVWDVGCAVVTRVATAGGATQNSCGPAPTRVLYVPLAGPFLYLNSPDRSRDFGPNAAVLLTGLGQVAGLGMALYGGGHLLGLPDAATPASGEGKRVSWQLLPSAPGTVAGGTLQLRM